MRLKLALAALLTLAPSIALAHTGVGIEHDLAHGFMHPLGGLDHILAMLAVGVFAYVLGGRALYLVPLAFVSMMVVGFLLGMGGLQLPFVELGIALSSVVIGGAAAFGKPIKTVIAAALVGVFAVFHGLAHGAEMPLASSGLDYALGFVAATGLLHLAGIAAALVVGKLTGRFGKPAARAAGGFFALVGVAITAGWL
jgi:urease accessory protein